MLPDLFYTLANGCSNQDNHEILRIHMKLSKYPNEEFTNHIYIQEQM